ncbi:MAG: cytochrome c oxidase subunit 3 [Pseudomonadota bacterium]
MAHGEVNHDYHLVNPSPWPLVGSVGVLLLAVGGVIYMKGAFGLEGGTLWPMLVGLAIVLYTMVGWWMDVVKESRGGDHTPVVQIGLRYGMILFIASEIMFFVAWFWGFFEFAIFHDSRVGETWDAANPIYADGLTRFGDWPPVGVETFDPFHLPLINTLVLLLSGTTITWSHHALQHGDRASARTGLILTVLLGAFFTYLQVVEYGHAEFTFDGTLYGSAFFMATGFHGAHVLIGTIFLCVCLLRLMMGGFTPEKHFGFEAAAWYWHFVDVVWLFLFAFVYVAPFLILGA